jgi:hypothetical protein
LTVLARPRRMRDGTRFDGKIGCFPFINTAPAKRNSKNRSAGTLVTTATTVDADAYATKMIECVMPALKQKMPWMKKHTIFVQQDGAPPHTARGNTERIESACNVNGWTISIKTQPAQSPDMNLCDLSFFHSLQKRQQNHWTEGIEQLIEAVESEWQSYEWQTLERQWWTLFAVSDEIMKVCGDNNFVIPHSNARTLQADGGISPRAKVNRNAKAAAEEFLRTHGKL